MCRKPVGLGANRVRTDMAGDLASRLPRVKLVRPERLSAPPGDCILDRQSDRGHRPRGARRRGVTMGRKKILVVEDNEDNRRILVYRLRKIGEFEIREATNGQEAIAEVR